ncbi:MULTISPECIES: hypothetical protein [Brevundimonas]|uniref:hypothetical protein n=1 Tax=Brevundimonas TaxID=41275 RepID=UPI000F03B570|nr:hypothetical protein [Brevundimonas lutea]
MEVVLLVLALAALAVGLVVWNIKRKPAETPHKGPDEGDTAWNDRVHPDAIDRSQDAPGPRP